VSAYRKMPDGLASHVNVEINESTGETRVYAHYTVVDEAYLEDEHGEMTVAQAQAYRPGATIGDTVTFDVTPDDFGRIAAQTAKQVILQKIREAEREQTYSTYADRESEIVYGTVQTVNRDIVTVALDRVEAVLPKSGQIPGERYVPNQRLRVYVSEVKRSPKGPQVIVSRTHRDMLKRLMELEIPEVFQGIVEIKAIAREAGSRSKVAVWAHQEGVDPVGACVGMRGSRVQAVVNELSGEKIDIIPWSPDPATFVVNALAPAEVSKVVLDEESRRIEVIVPDAQLSLAIGRRGQNVRLASQLTGWDIDILTEQEESERRQKEFTERSQLFMDALDVDEVIAQLLATEGFETVEEVAYVDAGEIAHIEGFDEDTAKEIQTRARDFLERQEAERDARRKELGVSDDLAKIPGVTTAMLVAFGENAIKTVEDLAGAETDDLSGWTERKKEKDAEPVRHKGVLEGFELSRKDIEDMIMAARIAAGWVTQEDLDRLKAEQEAAAAAAQAAAAAAQAAAAAPAEASKV
jgi:N utilization substance protein A